MKINISNGLCDKRSWKKKMMKSFHEVMTQAFGLNGPNNVVKWSLGTWNSWDVGVSNRVGHMYISVRSVSPILCFNSISDWVFLDNSLTEELALRMLLMMSSSGCAPGDGGSTSGMQGMWHGWCFICIVLQPFSPPSHTLGLSFQDAYTRVHTQNEQHGTINQVEKWRNTKAQSSG